MYNPYLNLKGLQPFTLTDYSGFISFILYFGGCNLKCPTCHNHQIAFKPDTVDTIDKSEVFKLTKKYRDFYTGAVVTGGEPTLTENIEQVFSDLKSEGLSVKLDSNGTNVEFVKEMLKSGLVDKFAIDIKGPFEKYPELTGGAFSSKEAKENITELLSLAKDNPLRFEFRTTLVPKIFCEDIKTIRDLVPEGVQWNTQNFVDPKIVH